MPGGSGNTAMQDDSAGIEPTNNAAPVPALRSGRSMDRPDAGPAVGTAGGKTDAVARPSAPAPDPALARFYMTSDLRAATSLTRTHLDFYLREGVIVPTARTESGYLLFDDGELATLRQVIAWRQDGIGIREIRGRLNRSRQGEEVANGDR